MSVGFRSPHCVVALTLVPASDPRVHHLDLLLGEPGTDIRRGARFSTASLLLHEDPSLSVLEVNQQVGRGRFPANTEAEISASVERWAELLRARFGDYLEPDPGLWLELWREGRERVVRRGIESRLPHIRAAAREAFERRDYAETVAQYEEIENELTRSEHKRLDIARRRAAAGDQAPVS